MEFNKNKMINYIYIFIIFLMVIAWITSNKFILDKNKNKKDLYLKGEKLSFTSKIGSTLGSYEYFGEYLLNQNTDEMMSVINNAYKNPEEISKYQVQYSNLIFEKYKNYESFGFEHINVFFPTGEKFISIPNINEIKKAPRIPNVEKKFLRNFSDASFYTGYRYVNMLMYHDKYLGTIEMYIPLSNILKVFSRFYPTTDLCYSVHSSHKISNFDNYLKENDNDKIMVNGYSITYAGNNNESLYNGHKKDFFNSLEKDIEDKLIKNESFEILKRYNNKNYIVLFFPLKASEGENVGHLIVIYESSEYKDIVSNLYLELFLVNILIIAFLVILLMFFKDRNKFLMLSRTDSLTKLYNRIKFIEFSNFELNKARKNKVIFSIMMVDLDFFKSINDNYGHATGDEVLKETAFIIKSIAGKRNLSARWGGEEFICFFHNTNIQEAYVLADKIRISLENHDFINSIKVTCSIGLYQRKEEEFNLDNIIDKADKALYCAKRNGRNRISIYNE